MSLLSTDELKMIVDNIRNLNEQIVDTKIQLNMCTGDTIPKIHSIYYTILIKFLTNRIEYFHNIFVSHNDVEYGIVSIDSINEQEDFDFNQYRTKQEELIGRLELLQLYVATIMERETKNMNVDEVKHINMLCEVLYKKYRTIKTDHMRFVSKCLSVPNSIVDNIEQCFRPTLMIND